MKRIALTVALLLGGTAVAHANPPGMTEPGPAPAPYGQQDVEPGQRLGPRGPMRGPDGPGGPGGGGAVMRGQHGPGGQHLGKHRLPPRVRARLVAMFDRNGDGRLEGPERRAARRFVKRLIASRQHARQGGPRAGRRGGPGPRGF